MTDIPRLDQLVEWPEKIEGASAYQSAKSNRQIQYQFAKLVPEYQPFYEEAEAFYNRLCAAMGVDPEPVFDKEEYMKSQHYLDLVSGRRA